MVIGIILDNIQSTAFQEDLPVGPPHLLSYTEVGTGGKAEQAH